MQQTMQQARNCFDGLLTRFCSFRTHLLGQRNLAGNVGFVLLKDVNSESVRLVGG